MRSGTGYWLPGGRQTGGGSYRFTAQINRRTLFDEMMKEAQMRRDTSGRNPFALAPLSEAQKIDGLDENETSKRYMHQYNFPAYSVGETKVSRGPGRREIGHGALAERALVPVLPSPEEFPYAIRAVSETFESNGSTSQASICASCMALMCRFHRRCPYCRPQEQGGKLREWS